MSDFNNIVNWHNDILGNYAKIKGRIGWKGLKAEEYTENGPYLIAGQHILGSKILWDRCQHLSQFRYDQSPEIMLQEKDIVISKDGTIGRVAYIDELPGQATINSTMMLVRIIKTNLLNPHFVAFFLQGDSFKKLITEKVSGSSVPHLFQADMKKLKISFPSLTEQEKIARILTTLDRVIEQTEQLIAKYEAMKQGLMQDLFTRGVDENGELRPGYEETPHLYKQSEIGFIPQSWQACPLKRIADVNYGISDPMNHSLQSGVDILSLPNINIRGEFILDEVVKIEPEKVSEANILQYGDLLFNWRNGSREHLGKTAFFDLPGVWTHVGFLLKIRVNPKLCMSEFLFHQLTYRRATGFFLNAKNQVNNTFNSTELENLIIYLPTNIEEQRYITSKIAIINNCITHEKKYMAKLQLKKHGLMQDLLTGRVRVQVDEEA